MSFNLCTEDSGIWHHILPRQINAYKYFCQITLINAVTKSSPDSICYCIHWLCGYVGCRGHLKQGKTGTWDGDGDAGGGEGRASDFGALVTPVTNHWDCIWILRRRRKKRQWEHTSFVLPAYSYKGPEGSEGGKYARFVAIDTVWAISCVHSPLPCDYQRSRATCLLLTYGSSSIELATTKQ